MPGGSVWMTAAAVAAVPAYALPRSSRTLPMSSVGAAVESFTPIVIGRTFEQVPLVSVDPEQIRVFQGTRAGAPAFKVDPVLLAFDKFYRKPVTIARPLNIARGRSADGYNRLLHDKLSAQPLFSRDAARIGDTGKGHIHSLRTQKIQ